MKLSDSRPARCIASDQPKDMSTPSSVASPAGAPKAFGRSTGVLRPQRTLMRYTLDALERRYCSAVHLSKAQRWIAAGFLVGTGVLAAAITGDFDSAFLN